MKKSNWTSPRPDIKVCKGHNSLSRMGLLQTEHPGNQNARELKRF
jgi:hypothetical protein